MHNHRLDNQQEEKQDVTQKCFFEHKGLFVQSGTEITQLKHIHSEMEVRTHFPVHAQCSVLTGVLIQCWSATTCL